MLIRADLGVPMAERIVKAVSAGRYDREIEPEEVRRILAEEVAKVLKPVEVPFNFGDEKPFVILVVGVNGSGKTTTIGKLGAIAAARRLQGHVRRLRHLSRRGHRAADRVGRAHRRHHDLRARRGPMPRAWPSTP